MESGSAENDAAFRAHLERGMAAYERLSLEDAYRELRAASELASLGLRELEIFGWACAMTGRDGDYLKTLERRHDACLEAGDTLGAARSAFWSALRLFAMGERGQSGAWLARLERLLDRHGSPCAESGYLLLLDARRKLSQGEFEAVLEASQRLIEIGERFGDPDLLGFGKNFRGCALIGLTQVEAGIALLDEAMLLATTRALSPITTGLVYCSVIACCHRVYALERASEWTRALSDWCESQPGLIPFTTTCQVHRAEVLNLAGDWQGAIAQAREAQQRPERPAERDARGNGFYQEAEVLRRQGRFAEAEAAYELTSQCGVEPQPGLSLLRLSQGNTKAAASSIRRMLGAATEPLERARFLPAAVQILLAAGEADEAASLAEELTQIAQRFRTEPLGAIAARAHGTVALARGDAQAALEPLRRAFRVFHELDAPYQVAELRVLLGKACQALGDEDGARLAFAAAREGFERLGAAPDLAKLAAPATAAAPREGHGLTARELEVLRLVARGKTNKIIASELSLSEKTVDRHVSNIFGKLGVPTRAAATAYAYEHQLI